jgi:hypothetical protein
LPFSGEAAAESVTRCYTRCPCGGFVRLQRHVRRRTDVRVVETNLFGSAAKPPEGIVEMKIAAGIGEGTLWRMTKMSGFATTGTEPTVTAGQA